MSSLLPLPKSVHANLRMTKSVSHPPRALPQSQIPILNNYYRSLFDAHGPQHWWPGRTRFEVIVGAILTQNTSWSNVEAAIRNLRAARLVSPAAIEAVPVTKLARLIRPSGYFRQKAKKLKSFTAFLFSRYSGSLAHMFRTPTQILRERLLSVHGIGPETADSILLYAGDHPVFVIDAYTRRILERHNLATSKHSYEELRALFESSLPRDPQLFNEFHALIVHTGKHFCRKSVPRCSECSLSSFLPASFMSRGVSSDVGHRPLDPTQ
jgi:endonuclease-3 related protein